MSKYTIKCPRCQDENIIVTMESSGVEYMGQREPEAVVDLEPQCKCWDKGIGAWGYMTYDDALWDVDLSGMEELEDG